MYLLTVAAVVLMAGRTLAAPRRRHRPVAASAPARQAPKRREDFTLAA